MNDIDPTVADVYRFFLHKYDKGFKENLNKMNANSGYYGSIKNTSVKSYFSVLISMSVSSYIIENEEALADFLEQYWI